MATGLSRRVRCTDPLRAGTARAPHHNPALPRARFTRPVQATYVCRPVTEEKKTRGVIGMSGGVDSSAAAALLLAHGYDEAGITLKPWPRDCISRAQTSSSNLPIAALGLKQPE